MSIIWKKVPYDEERGEFERTSKQFSDDSKALEENKKNIRNKYSQSSVVDLQSKYWQMMENTDSWETDTISKIQSAIGSNSSSSGSRSIENVLKEFLTGSVRAPIVLQYNEGKSYYLVAGNTRMMVARMLGISVKVAMIKSDW